MKQVLKHRIVYEHKCPADDPRTMLEVLDKLRQSGTVISCRATLVRENEPEEPEEIEDEPEPERATA